MERIFLDMDGVLVDFCVPAMRFHGVDIQSEDHFPVAAGFDIELACCMRKPGFKKTSSEFWFALDYDFWVNLKPYRNYRQIIDASVDRFGEDNVFISTTATLSAGCVAGKFDWIHENVPEFLHHKFFIGKHKEVFAANSSTLLVDDCDDNCERFNRSGGNAILVPRPWNSAHGTTASIAQLIREH